MEKYCYLMIKMINNNNSNNNNNKKFLNINNNQMKFNNKMQELRELNEEKLIKKIYRMLKKLIHNSIQIAKRFLQEI